MKTLKGRFRPKFPKKYEGDALNIIYRSSWELKAMQHFDLNPNVLSWQSEEFHIPYFDPTTGRTRRYFPDFKIKIRTIKGDIVTLVIEVKPRSQTIEPKPKKKLTKSYITEVTTWATNSAKWQYAKEYCADRGWEFRLMTEFELGIR